MRKNESNTTVYLLKESGHMCLRKRSRKWGHGHLEVSISSGSTAPPNGHIHMIAN